jgi:hypothetical protein
MTLRTMRVTTQKVYALGIGIALEQSLTSSEHLKLIRVTG